MKGLWRTKGVEHDIKLVRDPRPLCCTVGRGSPREEEVERESMTGLIELGVVEHTILKWTAYDVFVKNKTPQRESRQTSWD